MPQADRFCLRHFLMKGIKMQDKLGELISRMDQTSQIHCAAAVDFYNDYCRSKIYRNKFGKKTGKDARTELALSLMDIGKIYIAQYILDKGPELTEHEKKEISLHGYNGYRFLKDEGFNDGVPEILLIHTGEEKARKIFESQEPGKEFPEIDDSIRKAARIVNTLDIYIAMTQRRPYRPPFTPEAALASLKDLEEKTELDDDEETVDSTLISFIEAKIRESHTLSY